jgi:hypothetical protein
VRPHYSREVDERICTYRDRDSRGRFKGGRSRRKLISGYRRKSGVRVSPYYRSREELLANPMSWGEIGTISAMTAVGWIVTDVIDRYMGTEAFGFNPNPGDVQVPNAASVLGMPSWGRILTQAGIGLVGFGFGGYLSRGGQGGLGAATLNGLGLGATVHLIGQVFNGLMARAAGSKTSAVGTTPSGTMSRLYSGEIAAQNAQYSAQTTAQANSPAGNAVPGFAAVPGMAGAPVGLGYTPNYGQLGQGGYTLYNPMNYGGVPSYAPGAYAMNPMTPNAYPVTPFVPAAAGGTVPLTPVQGIPLPTTPPATTGGGGCSSSDGACWPDQKSGGCCLGMTPSDVFPD